MNIPITLLLDCIDFRADNQVLRCTTDLGSTGLHIQKRTFKHTFDHNANMHIFFLSRLNLTVYMVYCVRVKHTCANL